MILRYSMKITDVKAREILDSRGVPTISTTLKLEDGSIAKGEVPSGASTGKTEVLELRDNDLKRHRGKGVLNAVDNVNNLLRAQILNKEFLSQEAFDQFLIDLDGTELKTNFGGNAILSLSMAFARVSAISKKIPLYQYFGQLYWRESFKPELLTLPEPFILLMEGGNHGNWATDIQEYMIVPRKEKFPTMSEALRVGTEIFHATHDLLVERNYSATVGLEGAFAPIQMKSNIEAFQIIVEGIEKAGYIPDEQVYIAVDVAASEFYDPRQQKYILIREGKTLDSSEWMDLQSEWFSKFPVHSIEDPMDQEDWEGWRKIMQKLGQTKQIVGDDLLTTNVKRIEKARDYDAVNSVLIKLNQIGTVTETMRAMHSAENANYTSIISHRSGETNDDMIADLVVGSYAQECKFGGPNRGERVAKYNRLVEIEEALKA
jgi:enolase